ncbi:MAG: phage holin family protein [Coriobacteriia bacterium]|nr:phage holin family protein [Coriobacteriia bacterium]
MAEPDTTPEAPKTGVQGIIDAIADLLQTASDWLRQEAETVVREKVIKPVQRLGLTLVSASAAGCLLVVGLIFIAVGLFILLGQWITYPGALLAIGGVYVLVSLVFIAIKVRMMQK